MDIQKEREQFEAAAREQWPNALPPNAAWMGWQMRAALAAQPAAEPDDTLTVIHTFALAGLGHFGRNRHDQHDLVRMRLQDIADTCVEAMKAAARARDSAPAARQAAPLTREQAEQIAALAEAMQRASYESDDDGLVEARWKLTGLISALTAPAAAAPAQAQGDGWHDVHTDGLPPCDGETLFIGENDNGFAGVFNTYNEMHHIGGRVEYACHYYTAEEETLVLSGLRYWRRYVSPVAAPVGAAPTGAAGEPEGARHD